MKKIYLYAISLFLLTGCEDFLSKVPDIGKNEPIQKIAQLEGLINSATANAQETNSFEVYGSDDCGLTADLYKNYQGNFDMAYCYILTHFMEGVAAQASDAYWSGLYKSIYTANLIIANADKVEGDEATKQRVKADAHFLRAYNYWLLVNYYALPYSTANLDKPGVPLKKTPGFSESLKRASIREVYAFIEEDLKEAEKVEITNVDPKLPWRASKAAVAAFRSRYALFMGKYADVLTYAEAALGKGPELKDFNTFVAGQPKSYQNPEVTLEYCETNDQAASTFLYWPEFYYTRYTYIGSQWRLPSESLIQAYDKDNDLRFKWFFVEHGDRRFSVNANAYRYAVFNDGRYVIAGLTLAEVLLNKAEAQVRTGAWQQGMITLNLLREKRMKTGTTPLSATSQKDALEKVLAERRREFPFVMRLLDIRRYAVNETPEDDVTLTFNFWETSLGKIDVTKPKTYTIPVGSSYYAWPINGIEVDASKGEIEQNTY